MFCPQTISSPSIFAPRRFPSGRFAPASHFSPLVVTPPSPHSRFAPSLYKKFCYLSLNCLQMASIAASSALDKLLGQLDIYATWLSSIAYLQKQLRIFIFFTPRFLFFCDYTFSYCRKPSGMCLHIYSLPSSAFLKYQTRGFYYT